MDSFSDSARIVDPIHIYRIGAGTIRQILTFNYLLVSVPTIEPDGGIPIVGKGIVICKYPHDPTVGFGSLSVICLFLSCICGLVSVFYPYKGRAVPLHALSRSTALVIFLAVATALTFLAEGLMIWATVTESLHRKHNVHHDLTTDCPTAKTGLFGGAAFLALDASLFWLICQMLTTDARTNYEDREEMRGKYGQILTTDYTAAAAHVQARA